MLYWEDELGLEAGHRLDYYFEESGTYDDPYLISTTEDLVALAFVANDDTVDDLNTGDFSNVCFKQTDDISLSGYFWKPIGWSRAYFAQYDGNGHSIENIQIDDSPYPHDGYYPMYWGLFGQVVGTYDKHAVIENLTLLGGDYQCYDVSDVGGVIGHGEFVDINNCKVEVAITSGSGYEYSSCVGGIIGWGSYVNVNGCSYYGGIAYAQAVDIFCGGIAGNLTLSQMSNCINNGPIYCLQTMYAHYTNVGGLAGAVYGLVTIDKCTSNPQMSGEICGGGLVGSVEQSSTITDCAATGACLFPFACTVDNELSYFERCSFVGTNWNGSDLSVFFQMGTSQNVISCYAMARVWDDEAQEDVFQGLVSDQDIGTWTTNWAFVAELNYGFPVQREVYWAAAAADVQDYEMNEFLSFCQVYEE